jgi:hypothetical protein
VRRNESIARRIYEQKKTRLKYDKDDRVEKRTYSRFEDQVERKKFYKKNDFDISTDRVQKLLHKLTTKKSLNSIKDKNNEESRKSLVSVNENVVSRKFSRSCRHCDESH